MMLFIAGEIELLNNLMNDPDDDPSAVMRVAALG